MTDTVDTLEPVDHMDAAYNAFMHAYELAHAEGSGWMATMLGLEGAAPHLAAFEAAKPTPTPVGSQKATTKAATTTKDKAA